MLVYIFLHHYILFFVAAVENKLGVAESFKDVLRYEMFFQEISVSFIVEVFRGIVLRVVFVFLLVVFSFRTTFFGFIIFHEIVELQIKFWFTVVLILRSIERCSMPTKDQHFGAVFNRIDNNAFIEHATEIKFVPCSNGHFLQINDEDSIGGSMVRIATEDCYLLVVSVVDKLG